MNSQTSERYLNPFLKLAESELINTELLKTFIDDF